MALGISTATADRYWAYARAWLQREMAAADAELQEGWPIRNERRRSTLRAPRGNFV
jgi:hypothetical protein